MSISWQPLTRFMIRPSEVHLVVANLSARPDVIAQYRALLSLDEKERAERFRSPQHQSHFIVARGILRKLLADQLGLEPDKIEFGYQALGKPKLLNDPSLQFNLSHSGPIALYALSLDCAIGVDIEVIKACSELKLARRFFSQPEYQALLTLQPELRKDGFFQIWAQKEAFIKALGQGLACLDQFQVTAQGPAKLLSCKLKEDPKDWTLAVFDYQDQYKAAFATRQVVEQIHYWQI